MVSRVSLAFVALLLAAMPTVAGATGIVETGDQLTIVSNNSNVHAGPFLIDDITDPTVANFTSFCIEYSETILINGTYFAKVANVAVGGGRSKFDPVANALVGNPGEDPLSVQTANLYRKFLDGALVGYADNAASRDGLQLAIWRLEGEVGLNTISGKYELLKNNGSLSGTVVAGSNLSSWAMANNFYAQALNPAGSFASYDVKVVQLWANSNLQNGARQDQLVSVRASVPEPISTFSALLLGVSALGLARRRLAR